MTAPVRAEGPRPLTAQQIKDTAVEFFAAKGYHGTSLDGVAEELGVTRPALYYYFSRKHDLLAAICDDLLDHLSAEVEEASLSAADPVERLRAMIRAYVYCVATRPTYSAVVTREFTFLPAAEGRHVRQRRWAITEVFREAMDDAIASGAVTTVSARATVSLILGAANWVYRWFDPADGLSADDLADFAAGMLLDGIAGSA
ncbi:TetR/AcrR family transcriptional regulator [Nocardioides sp. LHD-245]|uniref:TetR/AcrR family transcriptional regulator n=1 Tax=Nocardioides sp. LHD-245 TaxID=3051387 RepID=UPI0027DFBDED|nr:TetR/AcrR family transcriptional regulator [Nocardioides sp. LHD-245]